MLKTKSNHGNKREVEHNAIVGEAEKARFLGLEIRLNRESNCCP